jgi:hypothetical protein
LSSRKGDRVSERTLVATIELSEELTVRRIDEAALAFYGLAAADGVGRPLADVLLSDAGVIDWAGHWASVRAGRWFERVMLHRSPGG